MRLTDAESAVPPMRFVYDAHLQSRTGQIMRDERRWAELILDPQSRREGATPLRCLLVADADTTLAYALYSVKEAWTGSGPDARLRVRELVATDPAANAAAWRYLLDVDLVSVVEARRRPLDDPILHLLADVRRAGAHVGDALWVRLVDVDRALAARTYTTPVDVVIEVRDDMCPWNDGRWRLSGDASGARCERTSASPDLTAPIAGLGAAFLGGTRLSALCGAGWIEELTPGAVLAASTAFGSDVQPWCAQHF
jgi:predicted acetyltransferase